MKHEVLLVWSSSTASGPVRCGAMLRGLHGVRLAAHGHPDTSDLRSHLDGIASQGSELLGFCS